MVKIITEQFDSPHGSFPLDSIEGLPCAVRDGHGLHWNPSGFYWEAWTETGAHLDLYRTYAAHAARDYLRKMGLADYQGRATYFRAYAKAKRNAIRCGAHWLES